MQVLGHHPSKVRRSKKLTLTLDTDFDEHLDAPDPRIDEMNNMKLTWPELTNTFWVLPGPKAPRPAVLWLNSAIILIRPGSNVAMAESVANSSKTTGQ